MKKLFIVSNQDVSTDTSWPVAAFDEHSDALEFAVLTFGYSAEDADANLVNEVFYFDSEGIDE